MADLREKQEFLLALFEMRMAEGGPTSMFHNSELGPLAVALAADPGTPFESQRDVVQVFWSLLPDGADVSRWDPPLV